ncbi:hypothetical protein NPIL_18671 [Nephila pilipes]|uniref:Uncharacterized protein n=1 Tax=Nephila pilipes TaxID=299642 RepID=A0A8X6UQZ1_NEPPI|nr:hypothetical protein NPIL_18671 [Nephila pilipes]
MLRVSLILQLPHLFLDLGRFTSKTVAGKIDFGCRKKIHPLSFFFLSEILGKCKKFPKCCASVSKTNLSTNGSGTSEHFRSPPCVAKCFELFSESIRDSSVLSHVSRGIGNVILIGRITFDEGSSFEG